MHRSLRNLGGARPRLTPKLAILTVVGLVMSLLAPSMALAVPTLTWTDTTLADMQVGVPYADGVAATSPNTITYTVSAGALPDGLSLDSATGDVTGTPTTAAEYTFTILASDDENPDITQPFDVTVLPEDEPTPDPDPTSEGTAPSWTDSTLGDFQVGVAYDDSVAADGDPTPTYSVSAGSLPDGVSLDGSTGELTGTPTTAGEFDFTLSASNGVEPDATAEFSGTVAGAEPSSPDDSGTAPEWTNTTLPELRVGLYVDVSIAASGDPDPEYSITAGALPDGLEFDNDGELDGAPSAEGDYDFTVTASNGVEPDAVHRFTGTIGPAGTGPTWTDTTLPVFHVGLAVNDGVAATGDPDPEYSIEEGSLPDGLTLDQDTGAITGTPTTEGSYDFVIVAGNGYGYGIYKEFTGTVLGEVPENGAPYWTDITLGAMFETVAYSDGVAAAGSPDPTYSVTDGSLPDGLTLDASTGAIAGTPTTAGDYTFEITATNGVEPDATHTFDLSVGPAPRGCVSYTGKSYVGALVLNSDGTVVGCGTDADHGAPADLTPSGWASTWSNTFGPDAGNSVTYTPRLGWACDDCSIGIGGEDSGRGLPIGFSIDFYGSTYSTVFVNSNGSISFGSGSDSYDEPLNDILNGYPGVVPFGIDLDDRALTYPGSEWGSDRHNDFFYWGRTTYQGHKAFVATWMNMNGYPSEVDKTDFDTFQVMLVDIDDNAGTNVDIIVNYGSLQTDYKGYEGPDDQPLLAIGVGSVSDGVTKYASIVDDDGTIYNGLPTAETVDGAAHALRSAHLNSSVPGRFIFQMRNGQLPETASIPGAPTITDAARGDGMGTITWTAPTDIGGSPILNYEIRWRVAGSTDDWSTAAPGASPYEIDSLTNGTSYEVQVAAVNGVGQGPWSTRAYFTPGADGSLDWVDQTLATMHAGVAYSDGVSASGTPDPTYSVSAGSLPDGLTLNTSTGAITGTPTTEGAYDFTITAHNGTSPDISREFTGTVLGAEPGMTLDKDSTEVSTSVHVEGWGFLPGSLVSIVLHSTPVTLAQVNADESGDVSADVTIPANTALGSHAIYLVGMDPEENALSLNLAITIVSTTGSGATPPPTSTASHSRGAGSTLPVGVLLAMAAALVAFAVTTRRWLVRAREE